jgi:hypothetical protein
VTIKRVNYGRGHGYIDTDTGVKIRGVTTILSDGLPKPALLNWAANVTAEYAVDRWDDLSALSPSKRLKELQGARYADRDAAANRGTQVHGLAERLAQGEEVDVPDALRGHVESAVRFLDDWNVQPVITEAVVVSYKHMWAGTLDLIADLADGQRWLLDYKTSRSGAYGDTAFQLAAYRYADCYLDPVSGVELPMPEVDAAGVAWIRADGYDLYPYEAGAAQYREFRYIQMVAELGDRSKSYKGEALTAPESSAP